MKEQQQINKRPLKPLKIALGDLKHRAAGKHSSFMPLGISFIASYALSKMENPDDVQFRFYTDPDKILKDIEEWQPDVIGLANYCWNSELSKMVFRQAKKMAPEAVRVAGGPNFPVDHKECQKFLLNNPEIDLYVYFEGERAFTNLIKKVLSGATIEQLKNEPQGNIMSLHSKNRSLVVGDPLLRITNMDEIPSPYLTGLMDQWFDGNYAPSVETSRGCPFTCAYCYVGSQNYYSKVAFFSVERVKQDLTYIAKKINKYTDVLLFICDSNFGIFERDEEIARHLRHLQDRYNWPNVFDANTGRTDYDRILRIAAILKNKMPITSAVQSLNPETLTAIKRRNAPMDAYKKLNRELKKRGMRSFTEVIAPMPQETKKSFFNGLETVANIIGVDRFTPYTLMLLKGTHLASEAIRRQYQMKTKFRIVPRQFGEYRGEKCFEIEEVCVATNTMSFKDYLEIRGFSLISTFFIDNQFNIVHQHLKELGISNYDYFYKLWQVIKSASSSLSGIYNQFIQETKDELWDSPEAIYDYFSQQENYNKLLRGELGDNLIRKYKTKILFSKCASAFELAYAVLLKMAQRINEQKTFEQIRSSLLAAKQWVIAVRDVDNIFKAEAGAADEKIIKLSYDVAKWYNDGFDSVPLLNYKKAVSYRIFYNKGRVKRIFQEAQKIFGGDVFFQASKLLTNRDIKDFWRSYEVIS